ncbi:ATP-dependent nuclease [Christiangramia crocea]|uniref:ATP-binding protein n=1 Tax=Christiangramia crocea TaxID=2904124 RepID=A0A9X1UV96_9FLAO|nr:AAA family ATPase [Gramella crocea]MCG9970940.1 ATP-binding protein [Gramella crocea]
MSKLQGIKIRNFRSFNEEGVTLDNLKKINVIIGKNNCGKSNVLRFLQLINSNLREFKKFPNNIQNQYRRNELGAEIALKFNGEDLPVNKERLTYRRKEILQNDHFLWYNFNKGIIELPVFIAEAEQHELIPFQNQYSSAGKPQLQEAVKGLWSGFVERKIKRVFDDLIYIPHFRIIKEGHDFGDSNSSINGSNIISKMFEMQNPLIGDENLRKKFLKIQKFVSDLINKPDLEIEIPHTKEEIVLTIDGNRLPLESFGTGIHQLVILCSTLVIHENCIVCLEEPEIHLHPELQRKFIRFLDKTNNQYFITTHSNIFLDSSKNTSIYHIRNNGKFSEISHADRSKKSIQILDDLGYQSSDILQSNGVIWVEGPSDRVYLLKWLKILDDQLIEGLHFTIMFYGGRLLSHLSFQNEVIVKDLISLLKLNRNAFVIMDRDGFTSQAKINCTKKRIKSEIGEKKCWITKGREIENYLTESTLSKWIDKKIKIDPDKKLEDIISKKTKKNYGSAKSKFSKEIIQYIDENDLNILDLKRRLNQLLNEIYKWNGR